ncbi:hypothetical protein Aduo_003467 [Ancylostoma duodenale]
MWWSATGDWPNLLQLVLQYTLVVYMIVIQTITFCTSEKKEPSSKEASKESKDDVQVMTAIAPAKESKETPMKEVKEEREKEETSPLTSQGLDISIKTAIATESKDQRGSAEDAGPTEKAPPKRVFPRRRRLEATEETEVGTEHTIYERRAKVRQRDMLEVEPTQRVLSHSPPAPKPEELAKALLKIQAADKKEKSMVDKMREWFEEQVTQHTQQQIRDAQVSSPRRRKSKRAPATLLPYQGTPVVHATPSEKAARTARATRTTPKQEPSEAAGNNDIGNDSEALVGEADSRDAPEKDLKSPEKKS